MPSPNHCKIHPVKNLLRTARERAKARGIPFTITEADIVIPEFCPVLGIRLKRAVGHPSANSPTLDRIVPSLGYVPGNVRVISHRANSLKSDATMREIALVLRYVRRESAAVEIEKHMQQTLF